MTAEDDAALTEPPPPAHVDDQGRIDLAHIASGHWHVPGAPNHGEFLLCGASIDYSTNPVMAPGSPACTTCAERDG